MKYLITGANGQLATEFAKVLSNKNLNFVALSKDKLDITDLNSCMQAMSHYKPDIIINCAAYNQVDLAESSGYNLSFLVNSVGVYNLAFVANQFGSLLVHYSTDYIFDGKKEGLYTEEDDPNPLNVYGRSKLLVRV